MLDTHEAALTFRNLLFQIAAISPGARKLRCNFLSSFLTAGQENVTTQTYMHTAPVIRLGGNWVRCMNILHGFDATPLIDAKSRLNFDGLIYVPELRRYKSMPSKESGYRFPFHLKGI